MAADTERLARFRRRARAEADACLLTSLPNVLYLTGFRGSSGALGVTRRAAVLFTDGRYRQQAREEVRGARVRITAADPVAAAARWLRGRGVARVSYEPQAMTTAQFEQVRGVLGERVELRPGKNGVEALRRVKDGEELASIRAGVELTARVFEEVLPYVRPEATMVSKAGPRAPCCFIRYSISAARSSSRTPGRT